MRKFISIGLSAVVLMGAMFVAGCDSGGGGKKKTANAAGTWIGTMTRTETSITFPTAIVLSQSGTAVSGTVTDTGSSATLAVSGLVEGDKVTVNTAPQVSGSTVTVYSWTFKISGNTMTVTGTVTTTTGSTVTTNHFTGSNTRS